MNQPVISLNFKSRKLSKSNSKEKSSPYGPRKVKEVTQGYQGKPVGLGRSNATSQIKLKIERGENRQVLRVPTQNAIFNETDGHYYQNWTKKEQMISYHEILNKIDQQNCLVREFINKRHQISTKQVEEENFFPETQYFQKLRVQYFRQINRKNQQIFDVKEQYAQLEREVEKLKLLLELERQKFKDLSAEFEIYKIQHERELRMDLPTERNVTLRSELKANLRGNTQKELNQKKQIKSLRFSSESIQQAAEEQFEHKIPSFKKNNLVGEFAQRNQESSSHSNRSLRDLCSKAKISIVQEQNGNLKSQIKNLIAILQDQQSRFSRLEDKIEVIQTRCLRDKASSKGLKSEYGQARSLNRYQKAFSERSILKKPAIINGKAEKETQQKKQIGEKKKKNAHFLIDEKFNKHMVSDDFWCIEKISMPSLHQTLIDHLPNNFDQWADSTIQNKSVRENTILPENQQQGSIEIDKQTTHQNLSVEKNNDFKNVNQAKTDLQKPQKELQLNQTLYSKEDNQKFIIAKEHLKIKQQKNPMNRTFRKKRGHPQLFMQLVEHLNTIRRSIGYRLQGFNFQFHDFQFQLMEKRNVTLHKAQIRQILKNFPFLLSEAPLGQVVNYIFMEMDEASQIRTDKFCAKMREFVVDFEPMSEQETNINLEKIKQILSQILLDVIEQMGKFEVEVGIVQEKNFVQVLENNKFGQKQIQLMLSQCCTFSRDVDHLAYLQYFSIFEPEGDSSA